MLIVCSVEGVLSAPGEVPSVPSTLFGHALYSAFDASASWAFLCGARNHQLAENWLLREGYTRYVSISTRENDLEPTAVAWKMATVSRMVSANHKVGLYLDSDPEAVRQITTLSIPAMLLVPPVFQGYARQYKPWDELVDDIERRRMAEAERLRSGR